jgi:regulatory protein
LHESGYPDQVTDRVLADLREKELLNDTLFARDWVRWRLCSKPVGKAYLRAELRCKGVERSIIENTLADYDDESELRNALALARKRLARKSDGPALRRLAGFLRRRGFSGYIVTKVFCLLAEEGRIEEGQLDIS